MQPRTEGKEVYRGIARALLTPAGLVIPLANIAGERSVTGLCSSEGQAIIEVYSGKICVV